MAIIVKKYEVRVDLNSLTYAVDAINEDKAIEKARKYAEEETHHDILKWATYGVTEMEK